MGLRSRLEALEAATGGEGGGCDRCRGTLLVVSDAITGEFHSARWNGETLDRAEFHERQAETNCPKPLRAAESPADGRAYPLEG